MHTLGEVTSVAGAGKHAAAALILITRGSRLKPVVRLDLKTSLRQKSLYALLVYVLRYTNQVKVQI